MNNFYLLLWLRWAARVSLCSIFFASVLSVLITFFIYINQGLPTLSSEVLQALLEIAKFWFPIAWSLTLLLALFRSIKYIFNTCISGYELKLYGCNEKEALEQIGYGDLVKVWRKWFMLIIWMSAAQMVLALAFTYVLSDFGGVFEWFDIYWLFGFMLLSGYFSFILLTNRCKSVKIKQC
jgi:hypothetical protein